jgi:hypothetical protein
VTTALRLHSRSSFEYDKASRWDNNDVRTAIHTSHGDCEHVPLTQLYADTVHAASGGDNEQAHDRLENVPDEVLAQLAGSVS